jgi:LmbE family N-acetylglucosaminyl deacetylase
MSGTPLSLASLTFPESLRVLVLAPHPDDFDAIGVTMRFLWENGNPVYVVVATSGASGVEDAFCSPQTAEAKARVREQEQRASIRFFGLPESHLAFLRLEEDGAGHPVESQANIDLVRRQLVDKRPAVVFLPHGHDSNEGHRRVYAMLRQAATEVGYPLAAFLNRDPKTIQMRYDACLEYGKEKASWKGQLLRCHQSQQQRNLNQRGRGFDERILRMDQESAELCALSAPYAEVFEIEFFGVRAPPVRDQLVRDQVAGELVAGEWAAVLRQ